jgi:hypothetical protein
MGRELCLIHANCQGDSLRSLLAATPDFARLFELRKYTNYRKEPIPQEDFDRCRVFLYQHLGERWNDLASDVLLARLHPAACRLKVPNLLFKGYWPLWTNKSSMNYGDILLDLLIARGCSETETLHIYLRGSLKDKYDLDALRAESLACERRKEKGAVIALTDFIEEHWRARQLFRTPNHPDKVLLLAAADAVLDRLGLGPVPPAVRDAFIPDYPDCDLPIHPQAGAHFGLPFAGAGRLYSIYGRPMNFARYAACYVRCLSRRLGNFEAFLHLVPAA